MLSLDDRLNATFSTLSDSTRHAILAQTFAMSGPAVFRHLGCSSRPG
jgi:hypothetical protein